LTHVSRGWLAKSVLLYQQKLNDHFDAITNYARASPYMHTGLQTLRACSINSNEEQAQNSKLYQSTYGGSNSQPNG
jgi:hypothetical protein